VKGPPCTTGLGDGEGVKNGDGVGDGGRGRQEVCEAARQPRESYCENGEDEDA
jgi:hypothetical protein